MPLRRIPDDSPSAWSRAPPDPPAISLLGSQPRSSSSLAHMAHRRPLRPHPWSPRCKAERGGCMGARRGRGHHRRFLGDLFLERKRLEIRMMGENISGRVATQSGIPTPGSASSSNRHVHVLDQPHIPLSPSPETLFLRICTLRLLSTLSPSSRPRPLNLSRYGALPSTA